MNWITRTNDITQLTQGSIVDGINWDMGNNPVSIVLSNACDLEHGHTPYLLVAALYPASDLITSSREFIGKFNGKESYADLNSREKEKINELLQNYIHHKTINRYYFIDCRDSDLGMLMMVDLQQIKSIPISDRNSLKMIANLNSPLKEQMMMQYVGYAARIPTDRVTREEEKTLIKEILSDIT